VPDADAALVEVLVLLAPPVPHLPPGIHPTALVDPTANVAGAALGPYVIVGPRATVGPGTQLHSHVTLGGDVRIGRDCVLWPGVVIRERVWLGDRVIVHPNTTIGADGFGYLQRDGRHVKIPQVGTVEIGDDVEIGAGCCVDRARSGATRIGRGAKIDNLVQIGHNVQVGEDCIIVSQCGISGSSTLGRGVMLGGQVGVADHVRIGDRARLIAQAGVTTDLQGDQAYGGSPAVPQRQFWRTVAAQQRLADLLAELRELKKRVARLESATNDQPRS
jgi:UDP-3-O-[3-hydroxymyristoyl] glucosamine N-acyltransferase